MDRIRQLESSSIEIIRRARSRFRNIAALWSAGKDSTTMLWLLRRAFDNQIPFPVIHIDTSHKFPEILHFRDKMAERWGLRLIVKQNEAAVRAGMGPQDKLECCSELKIKALKQVVEKHKFDALLVAIRKDEHGMRAKEQIFSFRGRDFGWDPKVYPPAGLDAVTLKEKGEGHVRVHPLLNWTETDIWEYIKKERMPVVHLYFARNGERYRSIGCACCTSPLASEANCVDDIIKELQNTGISERNMRSQDKDNIDTMRKLRSLGYL